AGAGAASGGYKRRAPGGDDGADPRNAGATAEIATIETLQAINETAAIRLQWAIRVQIGAFALLAVGLVLAVVAV
ncbi:hypothetical protein, partial [Staphylococcus aureus]|uniref:hypothetical protein n=1 Tax=Staphylococcus aureus TaxID=1280 RepID=UPI003D2096EE